MDIDLSEEYLKYEVSQICEAKWLMFYAFPGREIGLSERSELNP
jgi:hypothetical protein